MTSDIDAYEDGVNAARKAFSANPAVRAIIAGDDDPKLFALWLMRFSVHGVHMTRDVEKWISWAGERCAELGMADLGRALQAHARAEAGHDQLMVSDAHALADWWNAHYDTRLDPSALLQAPPLESTETYIALHEQVIGGAKPQCQLAIEYEIERLSVELGPDVVACCQRVFGTDATAFSFLADHVELDVGHTAFNRRQLAGVLADTPDAVTDMIETGTAALASYTGFLVETLALAVADLRTHEGARSR